MSGESSPIGLVVRVGEFNHGINFDGDLRFTIIKNANLVLNFDPNEVTRQGQVVENSMWELTETSGLYIFTYKGHSGTFPQMSVSRVGLSGTFNSPSSAKGQFPIDVTIVQGTGEEILGNNKDTEVLEYNNLGG